MAKKSVTGGRGITGIQFSGKTQDRVPATRSGGVRSNQNVQKNTPYTNQPMVDKGRVAKTVNPFARATTALRYAAPIGPSNKGTVPGGRGIMALNSVRLKPTAGAPKATMNATMPAPIKARVKPATAKATTSKAAKDVVRTTVGMKNSPTPKRGTNLGVKSGTQTGKTISRGGTGGRTTGGGRAAGGGYTNAGPAGMGASGRGTGGKR